MEGSDNKSPLAIKMVLIGLPLALAGAFLSSLAVSTYKNHHPPLKLAVVSNTHSDPTAVLGESTYYSPPPGYDPSVCPPPSTGTPPNCQPPTSQPSSNPPSTQPTTCPPPSTGTPPNCQPPSSSSGSNPQDACRTPAPGTQPPAYCQTPPGSSSGGAAPTYTKPPGETPGAAPGAYPQPANGYYTPPNGQSPNPSGPPQGPPTFLVNDATKCLSSVLGSAAAAQFSSGGFNPTPDQIAKAQNSGCFSARVSSGPPPGAQGTNQPNSQNNQSGFQGGPNDRGVLSSIPIAPPAAFQTDSPAMACAKQILGGGFGSQPSPDQMAQIQSKCFSQAASGQQIGFIDPSGQGRGGSLPGVALSSANPEARSVTPPTLPPEVKACVIKAGISEADINAISHGQSPTAQQQQLGEGCFSKYAKDKGYTPPTLTPPDPSQPFDPNSKQSQCADLVAQAHGLKFNQITPALVTSWGTDDIAKLRSCYGVAAAASASANNMVFAPTSPEVAISSSKLNCIQDAVGKDKLATVIAGTKTISETDRKAVYNKCINPTKIAAGANPALLGVLAAMPPSDLESQFIPVNAQALTAPTANNPDKATGSTEITIGGEVNVATGSALPTKVDVFVKSSSNIFTVALKKISDTKASWTLNIGQNKLPLGNHKAYSIATLADASQLRSPDATFAVAAAKAVKSHGAGVIVVAGAVVAALVGALFAWKWHAKAQKK